MILQSVVDRPPAIVTLSMTALQLLGNLCLIRDNLEELGKTEVIAHLDRYIDQLPFGYTDEVAFIDYATAALHWVYRVLPSDERPVVFRGYCAMNEACAVCAYAPKAEIAFFYQVIEPRISMVSGMNPHLAVRV